jgi:Protein of unknown function (DUF3011)
MKLSYDVLKFASSMALILSLVAPSTLAQTAENRQTRPAANKPVTLPSFPNRPQTERPKPKPQPARPGLNRPGANRPVTLPSYPTRPGTERPKPRPPIYRPPYGPQWGYRYPGGGRYFAGTVRCESYGRRFRNCYVPTRGRVVLERRHNGRCRYGNGWGYDRSRIWVNNNCRATFAYGSGSYIPRYRSDNDTALIIGGVAVAAGLVAILSNSENNRKGDEFPSQTATIAADLDNVDVKARPALRTCLERAASNVGATGGTKLQMTAVTIDDMGSGSYRFDTDIRATYPDQKRNLPFSCTANANEIEDFDFVTED